MHIVQMMLAMRVIGMMLPRHSKCSGISKAKSSGMISSSRTVEKTLRNVARGEGEAFKIRQRALPTHFHLEGLWLIPRVRALCASLARSLLMGVSTAEDRGSGEPFHRGNSSTAGNTDNSRTFWLDQNAEMAF